MGAGHVRRLPGSAHVSAVGHQRMATCRTPASRDPERHRRGSGCGVRPGAWRRERRRRPGWTAYLTERGFWAALPTVRIAAIAPPGWQTSHVTCSRSSLVQTGVARHDRRRRAHQRSEAGPLATSGWNWCRGATGPAGQGQRSVWRYRWHSSSVKGRVRPSSAISTRSSSSSAQTRTTPSAAAVASHLPSGLKSTDVMRPPR